MTKNDKNAQKCSEGNTVPPRCRNFCYTIFDSHINMPNLNVPDNKYIVMGREICPSTKKEHWQSFISFKFAKTLSSAIKILQNHFGVKCHVEIIRGTLEDNEDYCTKDNDYYTLGTPNKQGIRTDLIEIKNEILNGKKVDDITLENPNIFHQYGRTLNKIEDLAMRKKFRTEMTKGIWYYGKTGVGKSHKAFEGFTPETHYIYPNDGGWWDGYTQQEIVIINEFRGEIAFKELLDLCDKWPKSVKRRCREPIPFTSKLIIITSCHTPEEVYKNLDDGDRIDQLSRRFDVIEIKKMEAPKAHP